MSCHLHHGSGFLLYLLGLCILGCDVQPRQSTPKDGVLGEERGAKRVKPETQVDPMRRGQRWALLIANSVYENGSTLTTPPRDVALMRESLEDLGFKVKTLHDLKGVEMRRSVKAFSEALNPEDEVYLHYAGHGIEVDGEAMLQGVDFSALEKVEAVYQGYHVSAVVSLMSRAKRAVVVIDACRVNPFIRSIFGERSSEQRGLPSLVSIEPEMIDGSGVFLVFSTTKGEVAQDGRSVSPFVAAFRAVIDEYAHEAVQDLFSGRVQPLLMKSGQKLVTRTFGVLHSYRLRRPDQSCPSACQPRCVRACIDAMSKVRGERESTQEVMVSDRARPKQEIDLHVVSRRLDMSLAPSMELEHSQSNRPHHATASESGIRWINVPAGRFMMGSRDGRQRERPLHLVEVEAFQISETEVTVSQYNQCVEAGVCPPAQWDNCRIESEKRWVWGSAPDHLRRERHPVVCVDWDQARTFSKWVGGDLPTEAQWEYAARGGEASLYSGSDSLGEVAWFSGNSGDKTHEVGGKKSNGYGIFDMSGNAWEWVLDEWHDGYRDAPERADEAWGQVPGCGQTCSGTLSRRVVRGGGWNRGVKTHRVTHRDQDHSGYRYYNLGFRPAR